MEVSPSLPAYKSKKQMKNMILCCANGVFGDFGSENASLAMSVIAKLTK
jgi:hypothetical protein